MNKKENFNMEKWIKKSLNIQTINSNLADFGSTVFYFPNYLYTKNEKFLKNTFSAYWEILEISM